MAEDLKEIYEKKLNLDEIEVEGKLVFVRVDYNVPLDDNGSITDDTRIVGSLPTVRYLLEHKARIILASHLGRPKDKPTLALSLKPVAIRLGELLGQEIIFTNDCIGEEVAATKKKVQPGQIILLENLRFHSGETKNNEQFIAELAAGIDIFVNDAFGTSHRDQSSMTGIPRHVPVSVTGFLVKREIDHFLDLMSAPQKPFVAILGGAKVSDKIKIIQKLLERVDTILIGGGMAYTFLKALKYEVGNSLVEPERLDVAQGLMDEAKDLGIEFLLPVDNVVAKKTDDEVKTSIVRNENIPSSWMALDIGPETVRLYSDKIRKAKTVFWNGPMGVFEKEQFQGGTLAIAKAVAECKGKSVVGGGDSVAAINMFGLEKKITHLSTGGGASLEFIQGILLPGITVLSDRT
ncbi:phosphoglycerate kinase [bacterium]|nr:phosphoglycerate kinase [bacterium]